MTERQTVTQQGDNSNPARTYESYMVPALFGPWAERLIEVAQPKAGERVLDVGCGTGIIARKVAARLRPAGEVVGIDLSPNMLAVAREVAEAEGLNVDWHEARAEQLPFPDGSFDLVVCQFGLMFFEDRQAALSEMRRVLAGGGRVAISVWQGLERHPFYAALHEVIQRRLGMSGVQDIFSLGDEGDLRNHLAEAGLQGVEVQTVSMTARFPMPEAFLAGEIDVDTAAIPSMQRLSQQERQAITAATQDEMQTHLREATQDGHVVLPFHAYLVRAQA